MARPAWTAQCTNRKLIGELLPVRRRESHKGDYGRVLLLCGSEGLTGAARLAAKAALRTGSGLVYLGVPEKIYPIIAAGAGSEIVFPLPCDEAALHGRAACDYGKAFRNGRCAARPRPWPLRRTETASAGGPFRLPRAARSGRGRHKRRCAAYRCVARMCLSGRAYAA
jgi:hypothetical protein